MKRSCLFAPFHVLTVLFRHWRLLLIPALAVGAFYGYRLFREHRLLTLTAGSDPTILLTPQQIRSIENIGEWEFLTLSTEEMVDTLRKGLLTDDRLVRIYTGTLRLGINLKEAQADWITPRGDTVDVTLPPVRLLDKHFIDEARTRSFYESGRWNGEAKEQMYRKAQRAMLQRGLTRHNIEQAEQNARLQMESLFRSFGFTTVNITFTH